MSINFTDGAWEADYDNMTVHAYKEPDYVIAKISNVDSREEREGNLRLIAKAQEMYYSLHNMLYEFKRGNHNKPEYMKQVIKGLENLMQEINSDTSTPPEEINKQLRQHLERMQELNSNIDSSRNLLYQEITICKQLLEEA